MRQVQDLREEALTGKLKVAELRERYDLLGIIAENIYYSVHSHICLLTAASPHIAMGCT